MSSFFPTIQKRTVGYVGKTDSKIAIVGDYTSSFDNKSLQPFSGPAGTVLEQCLHAAGLIRGDVYLTTTIKSMSATKPSKDSPAPDFFDEKRCKFTPAGQTHVDRLLDELNSLDANVVIACGPAALAALCHLRGLSKYRGYVFASKGITRIRKVIPTHHPGSSVWKNYTYRHMLVSDLKKAKEQSKFPELVRPDRQLVFDYANVEEALQWLDFFAAEPVVSFDIEVQNFEVSCISFASTPNISCVIPVANTVFRPQGWTEDEEAMIWRGVQKVLGNPRSLKIAQNAIFDIQFLLSNMGIVVRGEVHDTMIGHSVMYPELPKGLGFLGSIYCGAEEYWKDTVKFNNIKGDS